jgi:hypothetical protein
VSKADQRPTGYHHPLAWDCAAQYAYEIHAYTYAESSAGWPVPVVFSCSRSRIKIRNEGDSARRQVAFSRPAAANHTCVNNPEVTCALRPAHRRDLSCALCQYYRGLEPLTDIFRWGGGTLGLERAASISGITYVRTLCEGGKEQYASPVRRTVSSLCLLGLDSPLRARYPGIPRAD